MRHCIDCFDLKDEVRDFPPAINGKPILLCKKCIKGGADSAFKQQFAGNPFRVFKLGAE
jgi:hypothetical protein